jgi:hypothetical protein
MSDASASIMESTNRRRVRTRSLVRRLVPFVVFCVTLPFAWMSSCRGGAGPTGFEVIAARGAPIPAALMIALTVLPIVLGVVAVSSRTRRARVGCDVGAFSAGVLATLSWFIGASHASLGSFRPAGIVGLLALGAVAIEALWAGVEELLRARAESRYGSNAVPP